MDLPKLPNGICLTCINSCNQETSKIGLIKNDNCVYLIRTGVFNINPICIYKCSCSLPITSQFPLHELLHIDRSYLPTREVFQYAGIQFSTPSFLESFYKVSNQLYHYIWCIEHIFGTLKISLLTEHVLDSQIDVQCTQEIYKKQINVLRDST